MKFNKINNNMSWTEDIICQSSLNQRWKGEIINFNRQSENSEYQAIETARNQLKPNKANKENFP
jgi:hypothetical protein